MLKEILLDAVRQGAEVIREGFDRPFLITQKEGLNNPVTEIDKKSEAVVVDLITKNYPDHQILSEEMGSTHNRSSYQWILDPIDGTVNFASGIPICCISLGLQKDGELILGAVLNPFSGELFFAEKGKGAFCNDQPIHVSEKNDFSLSTLVTGFPYVYDFPDDEKSPLAIFSKLIRKGMPVRRLGSAALDLCWVACGRFEAMYEYTLHPWDTAAGTLMIREAGGLVTGLEGDPYDVSQPALIASNGKIHQAMMDLLAGKEI